MQGLQLPLQKKLVVMIAFGFRLSLVNLPLLNESPAHRPRLIAISILRLRVLETELTSPDPSLFGVSAAVWTQIHISFAIVATTTPCFKVFMGALNTHYGGPTSLKTPAGTKASANSVNEHSMATLSASKLRAEKTADPQTRWDGAEYNVEVDAAGNAASVDSDESNKMIISKDTTWTVDFEEQGGPAGLAF